MLYLTNCRNSETQFYQIWKILHSPPRFFSRLQCLLRTQYYSWYSLHYQYEHRLNKITETSQTPREPVRPEKYYHTAREWLVSAFKTKQTEVYHHTPNSNVHKHICIHKNPWKCHALLEFMIMRLSASFLNNEEQMIFIQRPKKALVVWMMTTNNISTNTYISKHWVPWIQQIIIHRAKALFQLLWASSCRSIQLKKVCCSKDLGRRHTTLLHDRFMKSNLNVTPVQFFGKKQLALLQLQFVNGNEDRSVKSYAHKYNESCQNPLLNQQQKNLALTSKNKEKAYEWLSHD